MKRIFQIKNNGRVFTTLAVFFLLCLLAVGGIIWYIGRIQPTPTAYVYAGSLDGPFVQHIVTIEDRRFYTHRGRDPVATLRAVGSYVRTGRVSQGGSTIEQQYLKLRDEAYSDRSITRKLYETITAVGLNFHVSKDALLEAYLGSVEFPYGTVGVNAGCLLLYSAQCDTLSQEEQLIVIATFQTGANPFTDIGYARVVERANVPSNFDGNQRTRLVLEAQSLPPHIQPIAERNLLTRNADRYTMVQGVIDATQALRNERGAQDCCVIVRDERGAITSMNVCKDWSDPNGGKVNVCQYDRQTGSIIKPFVYAYAIEKLGVLMTDTRVDEPLSFPEKNGGVYQPKNFDLKHYGELRLEQALGSSINTIAVLLLNEAGVSGFVPFLGSIRAKNLTNGASVETISEDAVRFSAERQGLSLALGTYELSPEEFSEIWQSVSDFPAIDAALREPTNRLYGFGQDTILNVPGWSVKTGTSRAFVDGWTCGTATRELGGSSVCVRMGNSDATPMRYPGSQTAGVLWRRVVDSLK